MIMINKLIKLVCIVSVFGFSQAAKGSVPLDSASFDKVSRFQVEAFPNT